MVLNGMVKWKVWINKMKLNAGVRWCTIRTCMCLISSTLSVIPIFISYYAIQYVCAYGCKWMCVCACEKLLLSIYAAWILNNNVQQSYVPKFSRFHRFDKRWRVLASIFSLSLSYFLLPFPIPLTKFKHQTIWTVLRNLLFRHLNRRTSAFDILDTNVNFNLSFKRIFK